MNPMEQYYIHMEETNKYARHNKKETRRKMWLLKMIYMKVMATGMQLTILLDI